MASGKIEMYTEKQYELETLKDKINTELDRLSIEFKDEIVRELGETKTLLLIYERWYLRTSSYASLVIMLSEFKGYQCADIIATGGKDNFFSLGAETNFLKCGEDALQKIGFLRKM